MCAARLARNDFGTLLPSLGQAFPTLGIPERRNLGGKASLEICLPMPKIGWHALITLHNANGFPRRSLLSAMPAPATASLGRLQTQRIGEATEGPDGLWPNVRTVEESGRCQPPSSLRTGFRAVHEVGEKSALGVRVLHCPRPESQGTSGIPTCESGAPSGGCMLPCNPAMRPGPRRRRSQLE